MSNIKPHTGTLIRPLTCLGCEFVYSKGDFLEAPDDSGDSLDNSEDEEYGDNGDAADNVMMLCW